MKVSVVIPVYNEERYLRACLKSIFAQEEMPDEVIVVDNNSTDKSVEIAKEFPVKLVHEKHQGISWTRNKGFNTAAYDIIARTDADTRVPKNWIKRIKKVFARDEKLIGFSGPARFYDASSAMDKINIPMFMFLDSLYRLFVKHAFLFGPNLAIRKSAWEKVKRDVCMDNSKVHEDMDLSMHLAKYGKLKFDPKFPVYSSSRRLKDATAYVDYPYRSVKTITIHQKMFPLTPGKFSLSKWTSQLID
ncbi:MAG: glycosyltransferase family 2 protein [Patescibacteria group bacterium]|nr:glycosyltransferase family 2 protein [Patescibacteria group bacterium]MDE2589983.1 glycosyltransferase family 2 protein [Patescibacteria group bacterium]